MLLFEVFCCVFFANFGMNRRKVRTIPAAHVASPFCPPTSHGFLPGLGRRKAPKVQTLETVHEVAWQGGQRAKKTLN